MPPQTESLTTKIIDYIQLRADEKLEGLDKKINKLLSSNSTNKEKEIQIIQQKMTKEKQRFEPQNWLEDAANRAQQIQIVTHAIKYTHGDAKGSSLLHSPTTTDQQLISTASIKNPTLDIVGNAAALDVGKLLMQINHQGKTLLNHIMDNDISPLLPIANNKEQAQHWLTGFKKVLGENKPLTTHKLCKQVYWPTNNSYHLLIPLFSSAFAQAIYDARKTMREQQFAKDNEANTTGYRVFPDLAVQTFGGTKPQNISQLNSQRGGKNYLLDARPPLWTAIKKPPFKTQSVFNTAFNRKAYGRAKQLKKYLEKVLDKSSIVEIRDYRKAGIDNLIGLLISFAAELHALPAGWTLDERCQLPLEEQLWLDPKRATQDKGFRNEIDKKQWHELVARRFASWLNSLLESDKLSLSDVEHRQWVVLAAQQLRLTERARKEYY